MADITEHMSASDYLKLHQGTKSKGCSGAGRQNTNKYGAVRTRLGEDVFDSAVESRTFVELTMAKTACDPRERVVHLERSRKYLLVPKQQGERACSYIADFVAEYGDGRIEVIDTKSEITRRNPLYVLKRKLMLERYGIRIKEM